MACQQNEIKSGPLYVKYNAADGGSRAIEPCTGFWSSPDVWIEGGVDAGTARVGVPNTIKVRVRALPSLPGGASAVENVNVQVWVSDFTLGVGPNSGLPSAGGAVGLTGYIASISAGGSNVAGCGPWTPVQSDSQLNGGHVCIAANCHADPPDNGVQVPPNSFQAVDGSSKVCCDSHLAQRNIAVRQTDGNLRFNMFINNLDEQEPREFVVTMSAVRGALRFPVLERELLLTSPFIQRLPVRGHEVPRIDDRLRRELEPHEIRHLEARGPVRLGLAGERQEIALHRARTKAPFSLDSKFGEGPKIVGKIGPGKSIPLGLQIGFNKRDKKGTMRSFEIVQRTAAGQVVGGATIHAILA